MLEGSRRHGWALSACITHMRDDTSEKLQQASSHAGLLAIEMLVTVLESHLPWYQALVK